MTTEILQVRHYEEQERVSLRELLDVSGLTEAELRELVDYGALVPAEGGGASWSFASYSVVVARKASRLRHEFELDTHGVAVVLRFVERIETLETELRKLQARQPR
jgi:chaperone modulatory protein CbpM